MCPLLQHLDEGGHDVSPGEARGHGQVAVLEEGEVFDGGKGLRRGRGEILGHLEGQLG